MILHPLSNPLLIMIWLLLLLALGALLIFLYFKFFKLYKVKNICFIDGSLGTGKSFFSVSLAVRLFKKQRRLWKVKTFIGRVFAKLPQKGFLKKLGDLKDTEKPLLYSNIRLRNIEFVKVDKALMFRNTHRFAYKSVLLIDEFSLMADQFTYKDREMSERLSEFFKLFRHETKGGYCVINSQSTSDLHYSLKYVLSDYLYIHHKTNLPFFACLKVQEMVYSADKDGSNVVNASTDDIEATLRVMLVPKKYFRYYDTYCYSIFTDMLPVYRHVQIHDRGDSLKDEQLISFKEYKYLYENLVAEREKREEAERLLKEKEKTENE